MDDKRKTLFFRPWLLVAVTVIGSGVAGGIMLFHYLSRAGEKKPAWTFALPAAVVSALVGAGVIFLPWKWYFGALLFLAFNLLAAGSYSAFYRSRQEIPGPVYGLRLPGGTGAQIFVGVVGGALLGINLGGLFEYCYLKVFDTALSTFLPVGASRTQIYNYFFDTLVEFALIGAIIGGVWARRAMPVKVFDLIRSGLSLSWCVFCYSLFFILLFSIPLFHALGIVGNVPHLGLMLLLVAIIYFTAVLFSTMYLLAARGAKEVFLRAAAVLTLAFCFNVSLAIYGGVLSYDFLILGNFLEKRARIGRAQKCYQRSLILRRSDYLSSYLQYRIGLLYRKSGDNDKCQTALEKVVTSHNKNTELVEKAQKLLVRLKESPPDARRIVIPGVETRTEYKQAYCVPNSLSLILRYWKVPASAKEIGYSITALEEGTYLADELWYTHKQGLNHYLLPLADIDTVKRYLDLKIPLLVFLPGHVFAVFGYDEALDTLVTYDVGIWDIWVDQPVRDFLPEWKKQFSLIGLIIPREKEELLEEEELSRLQRISRGYFQYILLYHLREEKEFIYRLKKSLTHAPELFFVFDYFYSNWAEERAYLRENYDVGKTIRAAEEFMEKDFGESFALEDFADLLLDVEKYDELTEFLQRKAHQYSLSGQLLSDLALLYFDRGKYDHAIALLMGLTGGTRRPLLLSRAFVKTGAQAAAIREYAQLLEDERGKKNPSYLAERIAIHSLIDLCLQKGDYQTIVKETESYLKRYPLDARVQYYYARAQLEREDQRLAWLEEEERKKRLEQVKEALLLVRSLDVDQELTRKAEELLASLSAD